MTEEITKPIAFDSTLQRKTSRSDEIDAVSAAKDQQHTSLQAITVISPSSPLADAFFLPALEKHTSCTV